MPHLVLHSCQRLPSFPEGPHGVTRGIIDFLVEDINRSSDQNFVYRVIEGVVAFSIFNWLSALVVTEVAISLAKYVFCVITQAFDEESMLYNQAEKELFVSSYNFLKIWVVQIESLFALIIGKPCINPDASIDELGKSLCEEEGCDVTKEKALPTYLYSEGKPTGPLILNDFIRSFNESIKIETCPVYCLVARVSSLVICEFLAWLTAAQLALSAAKYVFTGVICLPRTMWKGNSCYSLFVQAFKECSSELYELLRIRVCQVQCMIGVLNNTPLNPDQTLRAIGRSLRSYAKFCSSQKNKLLGRVTGKTTLHSNLFQGVFTL